MTEIPYEEILPLRRGRGEVLIPEISAIRVNDIAYSQFFKEFFRVNQQELDQALEKKNSFVKEIVVPSAPGIPTVVVRASYQPATDTPQKVGDEFGYSDWTVTGTERYEVLTEPELSGPFVVAMAVEYSHFTGHGSYYPGRDKVYIEGDEVLPLDGELEEIAAVEARLHRFRQLIS